MNSQHQQHSIDLAKASLDNAQQRIAFLDTKVSVAVGLLVFLTPAPLAVIAWLSGLQGNTSTTVLQTVSKSPVLGLFVALALICGMVFASVALFYGVSCLSPRTPRGYKISGPFHNEWRPNILFPIYPPQHTKRAHEHFHQLHAGIDFASLIGEYEHQLQQLGSILHSKLEAMQKCFWWLRVVVVSYGVAFLFVLFICCGRLFSAPQHAPNASISGQTNATAVSGKTNLQHSP